MMLIRSKWSLHGISLVSGVLPFSTQPIMRSSSHVDSIFLRVSRSGHPNISMVRVLEQWVEEGRSVRQSDLHKLIKQLRKYRRFTHALQVSEWMSNERNHELSHAEIAIQLDLKSKVHGLDEAERYFSSIPETSRVFKVYCALLNCYAEHKSLEKAERTMQKIKDYSSINAANLTVSYNVMLSLYSRMGKYEEMNGLMQEMKDMAICNRLTYNIRLNAYVTTLDINGMEKFLMQMEADIVAVDWYAYAASANAYLKAGLCHKTLTMLKRSEQFISKNRRKIAYESLLTMYATIGNKQEVYRIWNMYKNLGSSLNSGYLSMLRSLVKLDDIDDAERILEEWESENTCFDIRIPNLLISAYCKKGLLGKAEAFISRALKSGMNPDGTTWAHLANGYSKHNLMEKAVEMVKKAVLADRPVSKLNPFTLSACIDHLKGKGDLKFATDILKLCEERDLLSVVIYDRLFDYVHNKNLATRALDVMKQDSLSDKHDPPQDGKKEGEIELREEGSN